MAVPPGVSAKPQNRTRMVGSGWLGHPLTRFDLLRPLRRQHHVQLQAWAQPSFLDSLAD